MSLLTNEVLPLVPGLVSHADAGDADGGGLPLKVADDEARHPHGPHVLIVSVRVADESIPGKINQILIHSIHTGPHGS